MERKQILLIDITLAFLWIYTAFVSAVIAPDIGYNVLASANIKGWLADASVYGGSLLDVILGVWILLPIAKRYCLLAQMVAVLTFTVLLTLIAPEFWLHPFGPVTKNVPIIVLIWLRYKGL